MIEVPALPASDSNMALLVAVVTASLVGSVHCAGMCGPFVAAYSASGLGGGTGRAGALRAHLAYHGARGAGYVALGAFGGAFGRAIDGAGRSIGVAQLAALVCSTLVVLWGASVVFPTLKLRSPVAKFFGPKLVQLGTKPRVFRAALLGGFTPFLPCGWLYAFVLTAAGTGSVLGGALVMLAFWGGTVPALLGMGALLSRLGDGLRKRVPVFTGVLLIFIGALGVVSRAKMIGVTGAETPIHKGAGSSGRAEPVSEELGHVSSGRPKCH